MRSKNDIPTKMVTIITQHIELPYLPCLSEQCSLLAKFRARVSVWKLGSLSTHVTHSALFSSAEATSFFGPDQLAAHLLFRSISFHHRPTTHKSFHTGKMKIFYDSKSPATNFYPLLTHCQWTYSSVSTKFSGKKTPETMFLPTSSISAVVVFN